MKNSISATVKSPKAILGIVLCMLALACISKSKSDNTARHGWAGSNGIVVPHDSFPSDCVLCHVEGGWMALQPDFTFDHELETGVALKGAHQQAQCLRCHNDRGPVSNFSSAGCSGCHEDVHQSELGDQCSSCHGEQTWALRDEIALHNRTRFPLVGSHAGTQCWTCHPGGEVGNWSRVDVSCTTCHRDEAASVSSPNHATNGWVVGCDRCHIPTTWDGAGFNHFTFALTGAHTTAACDECHIAGVYAGLNRECLDCHLQEYQSVTDPEHASAGFPVTCDLCHSTSGWAGAIFSHAGIANGCVVCHQVDYDSTQDPNHAAQGFPTACEQCHTTLTWAGGAFQHTGIVTGCVTCHLDDYNATTSPNHQALGTSQQCEQCHVTTTWLGAGFDHQGITNGCVACHQSEYNNTNNPNHQAAGFPTTCETCHQTNNWVPADFNHSFPINSGKHNNFDCIDCHLQPSNFNSFSCTHCHAHRQSSMDNKHSGVNGYSWSSPACLNCHPDGRE